MGAIEIELKNRIKFFEKRFGFRADTTIAEMKGNFFRASKYIAYMEVKDILKNIKVNL
ncbi:MAG: hypothetical protein GY830_07780 [Bacteroidetes bacterium]|nr:hypothetical protein [Bacteroidota bacterium]